jgi:hypothetical protein
MKPETNTILKLEVLESRRLLSAVWKGSDIDGDKVLIKLKGAGDFEVLTNDLGFGEQIETITVFDTSPRSKLVIQARKFGGDGFVDVGEIDAVGQSLNRIKVDGNLGYLDVGSLARLSVLSSETLDGEMAEWFIGSDMKKLHLKGDLDFAVIEVGGYLQKATIKGTISEASLLVDGWLRRLKVHGDVTNDSLVSVLGEVGTIAIKGFVDYSTIEMGGQLRKLSVGEDVLDSVLYSATSIGRIRVGGAVDNSLIESQGSIRRIDVWDWIVDSDILAGPEGIHKR